MSAPAIFRESRGLFYSKLDATGVGLVPVAKLKATPGGAVDLILWDPRDPHASRAYRNTLTDQGIRVGLYTDPHWYANAFPSGWKDDNGKPLPDPLLYRRQVSADVIRLLGDGDPVVLDFEKLPHAWQLIFLVGDAGSTISGWVGKGGTWWVGGTNMARPIAFTNEPHQDNPTDLYARAKAAYIAQLYKGNMEDVPAWQEAQWEQDDGQELSDAFPCYDAGDYDPLDFVPGSYLFSQNELHHLFV